jgi:hypothetical protein
MQSLKVIAGPPIDSRPTVHRAGTAEAFTCQQSRLKPDGETRYTWTAGSAPDEAKMLRLSCRCAEHSSGSTVLSG